MHCSAEDDDDDSNSNSFLSLEVIPQRTETNPTPANSITGNPPFAGIATDSVVTPIDNASLSSSNTDGSKKSTDNLLH